MAPLQIDTSIGKACLHLTALCVARAEARNATAVEPGTQVNVRSEEFCKAAQGEPSPLGDALLAFHKNIAPGEVG
jgi:hypothetical protein